MGSAEKFCLRWNDFESNISVAFRELREDKDFFDVTLACDDDQIQAHKVILSACSPFFRSVLRKNPHQHPLLYLKGVKYADLLAVLNFMYHGEVNVAQEELNSFLAVAEDLRVKGLTQNNSSSSENKSSSNPPPSKPRPREPPERIDTGPPPKRPRPPPPPVSHHAPSSSQDNNRQSFHANNDDDDIQEVVPVKSEPVSHTETNNTVAMAPPEEPYDAGPGHGAVVDPGADNSSMYGGDDYGDYGQYGSEADGSFDGSMMDASMAGSASADGNKAANWRSGKDNYSWMNPLASLAQSWAFSNISAENPFPCPQCGKMFKSKGSLSSHKYAYHRDEGMPMTSPAKEHECPTCGKLFVSRGSLSTHKYMFHRSSETGGPTAKALSHNDMFPRSAETSGTASMFPRPTEASGTASMFPRPTDASGTASMFPRSAEVSGTASLSQNDMFRRSVEPGGTESLSQNDMFNQPAELSGTQSLSQNDSNEARLDENLILPDLN